MKPNTLIDYVPPVPLRGSRETVRCSNGIFAILCTLTAINACVEHNYLCLIKAYLQIRPMHSQFRGIMRWRTLHLVRSHRQL